MARNQKSKVGKQNGKIQNDFFGQERFGSEYFCANGECSFRKRCAELEVGKLRGVGGLFHMDDEVEIAQKELSDLGNRKIAAHL